jgi:hypothetical protein
MGIGRLPTWRPELTQSATSCLSLLLLQWAQVRTQVSGKCVAGLTGRLAPCLAQHASIAACTDARRHALGRRPQSVRLSVCKLVSQMPLCECWFKEQVLYLAVRRPLAVLGVPIIVAALCFAPKIAYNSQSRLILVNATQLTLNWLLIRRVTCATKGRAQQPAGFCVNQNRWQSSDLHVRRIM